MDVNHDCVKVPWQKAAWREEMEGRVERGRARPRGFPWSPSVLLESFKPDACNTVTNLSNIVKKRNKSVISTQSPIARDRRQPGPLESVDCISRLPLDMKCFVFLDDRCYINIHYIFSYSFSFKVEVTSYFNCLFQKVLRNEHRHSSREHI